MSATDRQSRIDSVLAQHPLHAAYWALIAPALYPYVIISVATSLSPTFANAVARGSPAQSAVLWTASALVLTLVFARVTRWSESATGTPFGGVVRTPPPWLVFAAVAGAAGLPLSFDLVGAFVSDGGSDWAFSSDANTDLLGPAAFGPMMVLVAVILAPVIEEIGFRGLALGCLLGRGAPAPLAAAIVSAVFALTHVQYTPAGMLAMFLFGLFLAWLRLASRGLGAPIAAHMAANGAAVAPLAF